MRADLHVHTHHSSYGPWRYDAVGSPRQVLERARHVGIDCVAITDHDTVRGALEAVELARTMDGVDVIPGVEVSSADGHVVALDVSEPIPRGLSVAETVERIHDLGGIAVAAHPGRSSGVGVGDDLVGARFDAIEAWNARTGAEKNRIATAAADDLDLPALASSDAHHWKHVGRAYSVIDGDDVPSALRNGSVDAIPGSMRTAAYARLYAAKAIRNLRIGRT